MIVQGFAVTDEQQKAGIAAMAGEFTASNVRRALVLAGVPAGPDYTLERVADRLMQRERRAGRIRAINNKTWAALA